MNIRCFIPARLESSRFPGKALYKIHDKPALWWTYHRAMKIKGLTELPEILTDSEKIAEEWWGNKIRSQRCILHQKGNPPPRNGTERIAQYLAWEGSSFPDDIIINVQGDQVMFDPEVVSGAVELYKKFYALYKPVSRFLPVWTIGYQLVSAGEDIQSTDIVKIAMTNEGGALYFSRALIPPFFAGEPSAFCYTIHAGIYIYSVATLRAYLENGPTRLEKAEGLEQLRFLEMGIPIHVCLPPQEHEHFFSLNRFPDVGFVSRWIKL